MIRNPKGEIMDELQIGDYLIVPYEKSIGNANSFCLMGECFEIQQELQNIGGSWSSFAFDKIRKKRGALLFSYKRFDQVKEFLETYLRNNEKLNGHFKELNNPQIKKYDLLIHELFKKGFSTESIKDLVNNEFNIILGKENIELRRTDEYQKEISKFIAKRDGKVRYVLEALKSENGKPKTWIEIKNFIQDHERIFYTKEELKKVLTNDLGSNVKYYESTSRYDYIEPVNHVQKVIDIDDRNELIEESTNKDIIITNHVNDTSTTVAKPKQKKFSRIAEFILSHLETHEEKGLTLHQIEDIICKEFEIYYPKKDLLCILTKELSHCIKFENERYYYTIDEVQSIITSSDHTTSNTEKSINFEHYNFSFKEVHKLYEYDSFNYKISNQNIIIEHTYDDIPNELKQLIISLVTTEIKFNSNTDFRTVFEKIKALYLKLQINAR